MTDRIRLSWRSIVALFAVTALTMTLLPVAGAKSDSAKALYKQGVDAEAKEDYDAAFRFYHEAFVRKPSELRYKASAERLRPEAALIHVKKGRKLRDGGDNTGALTEFMRALEIDPSLEIAQQEIEITRKKMAVPPPSAEIAAPETQAQLIESAESPIDLRPISNEPLTIHMDQDAKVVYQTIGKEAGLNVLFDPEYTAKRIPIDLTNTTLYDALRIVSTISGTFWKPVTPNTIFVAQDTRAKRTQLEQQAVRTFYLANPSQQQDLNDVQTALRNVLGELGPKFYAVPSQNAIVARGTPDQLLLAEKLIDDLDKARAEVVVDVAVMQIDRDKIRNIGIQLPQSFAASLQSATSTTTTTSNNSGTTTPSTTTPTNNLTLNDLGSLNATNFAVTVGQAQANLLLTDTNSKILQNPRIRATDGQKATLKIGERIPIATGSYSTGTAATAVSSLVNTQFQYIDIGVNVEMTPTVHYNRDVSLKIKIEVLSENGNVTISGVTEPIISQRSIDHVIRLKEGEANILGGIFQDSDTVDVSGTPGLGEIPLLKYLFSSQYHEVQHTEVVFLLIPHVVRAQELSPLNLRTIDTGTGSTLELRRAQVTLRPISAAAAIQALSTGSQDATASGADSAGMQPSAQPVTQPNATQPNAQSPRPFGGKPSPAIPAQVMPAPPAAVSTTTNSATPGASTPSASGAPIALQVSGPTESQKVGATFQVAVNLANGQDVFSVPLQMQYDVAKLTLVNIDSGEFLNRGGEAVALVHRDDGVGGISISASRPPGTPGVSGQGTLCMLTFQSKSAGDAKVSITAALPRNSAQQPMVAVGSQTTVHIQ